MNAEELAAWPRTPNKPMAFTPEEFIAGAFRALGLHLVLFLIACVLAGTVAAFVDRLDQADSLFSALGRGVGLTILVQFYAVPISLLALLIGVMPALLLGRAIVRVADFRTHVIAWAGFGIVFSGAVTAAVITTLHLSFAGVLTVIAVAGWASGSVAITLAWARTASLALRKDRGLTPQPWFRRRYPHPQAAPR